MPARHEGNRHATAVPRPERDQDAPTRSDPAPRTACSESQSNTLCKTHPPPNPTAPVAIIGKLTTHVLDTANGCPAAGLIVTLTRLDPTEEALVTLRLDADGRAAQPLLEGAALRPGRYRLTFATADYFRTKNATLADPPFLDRIPIEFAIADADAGYHVPLLVSPWSYATYRGS